MLVISLGNGINKYVWLGNILILLSIMDSYDYEYNISKLISSSVYAFGIIYNMY